MKRKTEDEKSDNSRQKILDSAAALFAEKGFDGSRVDEIAEKAGVNKALIYYYFESKEKILDKILDSNTNEFVRQKKEYLKQIDKFDDDNISKMIDFNLKLFNQKSDIFKIAFTEALKDNKQNNSLFKMMDTFYMSLLPFAKEKGLNIEVSSDYQIISFLFGLAPMLTASVFGEKWAEFHGIPLDDFNEIFSVKLKEVFKKIVENMLY